MRYVGIEEHCLEREVQVTRTDIERKASDVAQSNSPFLTGRAAS